MMERECPREGEVWRHFKGGLYFIIGIAIHSETREPQVVYQALHGTKDLYVRPLDMFMSPTERKAYSHAVRGWCFEKKDLSDSV